MEYKGNNGWFYNFAGTFWWPNKWRKLQLTYFYIFFTRPHFFFNFPFILGSWILNGHDEKCHPLVFLFCLVFHTAKQLRMFALEKTIVICVIQWLDYLLGVQSSTEELIPRDQKKNATRQPCLIIYNFS